MRVSNAASAGWGSVQGAGAADRRPRRSWSASRVWEWRSAQPAFPIRSFSDPELLVGALSGIGFNIGNAVVAIQLSLLWQYVYRFKPLEVSLGQLPFIIACIGAASWAGSLVARGVSMRLMVPGGLLAMAASPGDDGLRPGIDALHPLRRSPARCGRRPDDHPDADRQRLRGQAGAGPGRRHRLVADRLWPVRLRTRPRPQLLADLRHVLRRSCSSACTRPAPRPASRPRRSASCSPTCRLGDTEKFDARLVQEVIASGTSAYLAQLSRDDAGDGLADRGRRRAVLVAAPRARAGALSGARPAACVAALALPLVMALSPAVGHAQSSDPRAGRARRQRLRQVARGAAARRRRTGAPDQSGIRRPCKHEKED